MPARSQKRQAAAPGAAQCPRGWGHALLQGSRPARVTSSSFRKPRVSKLVLIPLAEPVWTRTTGWM